MSVAEMADKVWQHLVADIGHEPLDALRLLARAGRTNDDTAMLCHVVMETLALDPDDDADTIAEVRGRLVDLASPQADALDWADRAHQNAARHRPPPPTPR